MYLLFQSKKEEGGKDKASIEDSAFEALEKDFQDVNKNHFIYIFFFIFFALS